MRVLIVDDEALARRGLRRFLENRPDFLIEGEASNGSDAAEAIKRLKPDLVFLDIQMPLLDGFDVIGTLDTGTAPEIVFVTAFDEHAIRAFESGAIDYVLKPINPQRFEKTLDRVRRRINSNGEKLVASRLSDLFNNLIPVGERYLKRLALRFDERITFLNVNQIDWITSQGNYIELHSKEKRFLLRETMSGIEQKLDPLEFLRIRRATIVRIGSIRELQVLFNGVFCVVMEDGTELTTSRRYRRNIERFLKI